MNLLTINTSGPAHLVGRPYTQVDPSQVPLLPPGYIAVHPTEEADEDLACSAPFVEDILYFNGEKWNDTGWAGLETGFTYAMPSSWFTSLPTKEHENKPD